MPPGAIERGRPPRLTLVTRPGQWCTTEIQRATVNRAHGLDAVRIEKLLQAGDRCDGRGHVEIRAQAQRFGKVRHQLRLNQRLISLQIDDHVIVAKLALLGALGAERACSLPYALIVCRYKHRSRAAGLRPLPHPLYEWTASDFQQWLAREPGSGIACRNDDMKH